MAVLSIDRLPLGFRFRPTDEELINHYLRLKINGRDSEVEVIPEVDVCKWEPWDLPGLSVIKTEDPEWFFFCPRDRKYPNGHRSNRATDAGYWKATGKDRTIKSRRPNQIMIGMKKTLVFYRGRAPKGQRTHWIMHEYRPTLKELDGAGPGQSAFVLCRLFRKSEEKIDSQKYDEVEPSGSSPSISKSSPDDTSLDLVQEAETAAIREGKETEGRGKQFNQSNNVASNALVPGQSCSNSHVASDGEDHVTVVTPTNEYTPLNGNSDMYNNQFGCEVSSLVQLQVPEELAPPYMDSPYASDFGHDHYGLQFQNGTCEEDVSFIDLFDGVFPNNDECSGEESTSQTNSVFGSGTQLAGHARVLENIPLEYSNSKANDIYGVTNTEMSGLQHNSRMGPPGSCDELSDLMDLFQIPASFESRPVLGEESRSNVGDLGNISVGQDVSSAHSAMGSFYDICNNFDGSIRENNPLDYGSTASGTGIKIRNRQPQQRPNPPNNFGTQGTAPRRIRLSVRSIGNGKVNDSINLANEDEAIEATKQTAMPDKSVDGKASNVSDTRIKSRTHRTRQHQHLQNSDNTVPHRDPQRRVQSNKNNYSSETVDNGKIGDASCGEDKDGVQSALAGTTEAAEPGLTFKSENETQLPKIKASYKEKADDLSGKLRLRSSQCDDCGSQSPSFTKAPSAVPYNRSSSRVYGGSIFLAVVISMISFGVWMYGK